MNWIVRARAWRATSTAALVGGVAVVAGLLLPAESVLAEVRRIRVNGTPVTVTQVNTHNWGSLSPNNVDTVALKDGSRGSYWSFDLRAGQCARMTMRSTEFPPYLSLRTGGPDGPNVANHDGANGRAQITLVNANGGTYYLLASSSGRGERRGSYTLDIEPC